MQIDENEIIKTIAIMKPDNEVFEIRIICENKKVYSGYFNSADELIKQLKKQRIDNCNVYITLNKVNEACFDRTQKNKFEMNSKATTSDTDIVGYEWIMVDLDPKRPTGTSSSEEELQDSKTLANEIFKRMKNIGFETPLVASSGNGVHLLYKVQLKQTTENQTLVKKALQTLNMLFDNETISVDVKNFNPARICKLYGTMAQKGSNTNDRPFRMSKIISKESEFKATDKQYIEKLVKLLPAEEKPQKYNNYQPKEFDLEDWMSKYGLHYRIGSYADGVKYILDCCPFDSNHNGKDACIFRSRGGAIGFHCFHNSCADKTWQDVRMMYEPDAYEKKRYEYEQRIYEKAPPRSVKKIEPVKDKPVFYTAMDILNFPRIEESFVKSGITEIDKKMRGLKKGYVSVMSGLRGSGKSSIISEICLDCVENGKKTAVFSGELAPKNFMRWMNLQAAGKGHTAPTQFVNYYNVKDIYQKQIAEWLGNSFILYNNDYGNDFKAVIEQFEKVTEERKLDLLILDNLMAFDISTLSNDKYESQSKFVLMLEALAKKLNIHILFVAHPRKAMGFLRLDDISGTADIGNAVDNAFIVHRVNKDFIRLTGQMFGWKSDNQIYQCSNVIEIAKDRDGGIQDYFIPLYYEVESKRLKNSPAEMKLYGWDKSDGFVPVPDNEELPWND